MNSHNNKFTKEYFEDGIKAKVSAYENYRWMPDRSIREANSILKQIPFTNALDFGCAKGFLVYALRLLGKDAYGVDISSYAIKNCHKEIKKYVKKIDDCNDITEQWDLIIAKDVLEHLQKDTLDRTLKAFRKKAKRIFFIVPLGEKNKYRIREYEMDVTHIIREPEEWWLKAVKNAGFEIEYFDYSFGYIKDHWTSKFPYGNAFIVAK